MTSKLHTEARRRLKAQATPAVEAGYERYFKGALTFHGVRGPAVKALSKELLPALDGASADDILCEAFALVAAPFAEEKQIGIAILYKHRKKLPRGFVARLEPVFDESVADWATCDGICGRVLRYQLKGDAAALKRIVGWSRSINPWRQRAAAVSFVNEARHGAYNEEILVVCENAVSNPDRFVQLGVGWVLRELYLANADIVLAFLGRHHRELSREGLRYAIEKMPKSLQQRLLDEHAAAKEARRD